MAQIIGTESQGIGKDRVCPGPTETPTVNMTSEERRPRMAQRLPPKRTGGPESAGEAGRP